LNTQKTTTQNGKIKFHGSKNNQTKIGWDKSGKGEPILKCNQETAPVGWVCWYTSEHKTTSRKK